MEGAVTGNITGDVLASGDSSVIVDSSEKAFIGDLTGDVKASGGAVIIDSSANTVTTTKVIGNLYSANDILILDKGTTANTAVFNCLPSDTVGPRRASAYIWNILCTDRMMIMFLLL